MSRVASAGLALFGAVLLFVFTGCENIVLDQVRADVSEAQALPAPTIVSVTPTDGSTSIGLSPTIEIEFSIDIAESSITDNSVQILRGDSPITRTAEYIPSTRTIVMTPAAQLERDTSYGVRLTTGITNTEGRGMANTVETTFRTLQVSDSEIVIDLEYTGPYLVDDNLPMYVVFYAIPVPPNPEGGGGIDPNAVAVFPFESFSGTSGRLVVDQSELPDAGDDAYLVKIFHDLDNSFDSDPLDFEDDDDAAGVLLTTAETGLEEWGSVQVLQTDGGGAPLTDGTGAFLIIPEASIGFGNYFAVEFPFAGDIDVDVYETNDETASYLTFTQNGDPVFGDRITRTIALTGNDEDYFIISPSRNDLYNVLIDTDPDGSGGFDARISLHSSRDAMLNDSAILESNSGNGMFQLSGSGVFLEGGSSYYLKVEGDSGSDFGTYRITPVLEAVADDGVGDTIGTAGAITFGRDNAITGTDTDTVDYYAFEADDDEIYIFEIRERPDLVHAGAESRGLDLTLTVYDDTGSNISAGRPRARTVVLNTTGGLGADTYYLAVASNQRYGNTNQPLTAHYELAYTAGPDIRDWQFYNSVQSGTASYPQSPESSETINAAYGATTRTIYSLDPSDTAKDDEDWIWFSPRATGDTLVFIQPAVSEGIDVVATIYPEDGNTNQPDLGTSVGSIDNSDGRTGVYVRSSIAGESFWIRVQRDTSSAGNPVTGRYTVEIRDGSDVADYADPVDTVPAVDRYAGHGANNVGQHWEEVASSYRTDFISRTLYRRDYEYVGSNLVLDETIGNPRWTDVDWYFIRNPDGTNHTVPGSRSTLVFGLAADIDLYAQVSAWHITDTVYTNLADTDISGLYADAGTTTRIDETWLSGGATLLADAVDLHVEDFNDQRVEIADSTPGDWYVFKVEIDTDFVADDTTSTGAYYFWVARE